MKRSIRRVLGRIIFDSRLNQMLLSDTAAVVAFHRVNDLTEGGTLTCSVELFERYCQFFADHFRVVPLRHLVEKLEQKAKLNRELAITFDDGYRDNLEFAVPVLRRFGLPATFFVVTQFIGTDFAAWWDKGLTARHAWLSWDEVRALHREGFDVGAHTRSHADLGKVVGPQAWDEIRGSRRDVEEQLSATVDLFAYPYGGRDNLTAANLELVRAAGFRCCCSCAGGTNAMGADPFRLGRIPLSSWYRSPSEFACDVALRRV